MTRILIIGYMGAGKTTLGKVLAESLGLPFYDLDWYIESRMMKTVPQLFAERGEEGFRKVEHNMLHEVAEFEDVVISCGGGTPCFYDNMEYMNAQGDTVYLKASPEVLYAHLQMGKVERPLLKNKTREEMQAFIQEQLAEREKYYTKARHIFNVDLLDNYEKIQTSVNNLRKLLNI
ncbi:shikimate kinase [uncultured Prevotella sp.]|uniref:shikimate kinase n=1 Tax=uncultured Prevotella sp. TaxID=159272 RepID=UPI0025EC0935|nr:shikimate kinase [uncultured Prevotella sp.]